MPSVTTGTARTRREDEYTPGSANYYNHQYQTKGTPPPSGFEVGKSGTVSTEDSGFSRLVNSPLFPLLMVGGFGGGGLLGGALAGQSGAAAGSGAATAASALPPTGYGASFLAPGAAATTAGAGGTAAGIGGALGSLTKWLPLIGSGVSLGGGIFAGKSAENARKQASGGMDFAAMQPLIMALIQQQMQQSGENYQAQQQKAQQAAPLQQAMSQLAMRLMPRM